ncbi:WW domain-containing oxidoreductase-like isoform X2 [Clavelina lepadiformis]|uniref:WW domain-containing oxidoreductase-like isoform X2 n=1 Tax=Clavelina lepadiformis TaxID=159417 RepID=UPI0040432FD9
MDLLCKSSQSKDKMGTSQDEQTSKDLPYGWERLEDDEGRVYYVDHTKKRTTYTDPRLAFATDISSSKDDVIRQRYDASSSTDEILMGYDLSGKVAIVTGASAGIGLETARALSYQGCKVIMACRNMEKTETAIRELQKDRKDARLIAMELNLASLQSVKTFANEFKSTDLPLHMLILNAGVFALPWQLTEDGIERMFATNHVGHFYLTKLLTPILLRSAPARVVVVSSESHRFPATSEPISLEKLNPPATQFWSMVQYNRSKLCNVLFSNELNRRLSGLGVISYSLHPGNMMYTSLPNSYWFYKILFFLARPFTKSMRQGASCTIYAAVAPELQGRGGLYLNNCFPCDPLPLTKDRKEAKKLWTITEELIRDRLENGHFYRPFKDPKDQSSTDEEA